MQCTKGQRFVLIGAWGLPLASTIFPPTLGHTWGGPTGSVGFGPVWRVLLEPSRPGARVYYSVHWSTLLLLWVWIALGAAAGLWALRARWRRPSRCEACGYSLAGLAADAAYPECGARG